MKILSRPKKNAAEYGKWAVNPYLGCPNDCVYCYRNTGPGKKVIGGSVVRLKKDVVSNDHAYHLAMVEIIEHKDEIIRDGGLFFTFTSDPCLPTTCDLTFQIAADAMNYGIPVTLLTKNADFCGMGNPSVQLFAVVCQVNSWLTHIVMFQNTYQERLAIGFTLTGRDDLEPLASSNQKRINALEYLNGEGWLTWASIEPVIDFDSSLRMIQQALDAGCQHFKIGLMTEHTKVCRRGFTLGGKTFEPYDPARCLAFVQDVMTATRDRATVYWKQSFRDFIGGTGKHRLFTDDELHKIFDDYPNAVGKDWSMFNPQNK